MRLIDYFDRGCEINPNGDCLVSDDDGSRHSYTHVRNLTLKGAQALRAAGFESGKGAVLSLNHPLAVVATLTLMRADLTWVPLNPRDAADNHAYVLENFDCDVLFYQSRYAESVAEFRRRIPGIKLFVCLDEPDGGPAFLDWIAAHEAAEIPLDFDPEGIVMMAGTGGTTGQPKGVMQTHRALEIQVLVISSVLPFRKRPVYFAVAPLTHAAGYITYPIYAAGGTLVLQGTAEPKNILSAIERHGVSSLFLPPTLIYLMLAEPSVSDFDYSSLEFFMYGASPMSPTRLREAIEVLGPVMTQMFGQTETLFPLTYLPPAEHFVDHEIGGEIAPDERLRSCGRAAPGVELAIMSEDGQLLEQGETGEIVVRSLMVMKGYYQSPEATTEAFAHGWYHTGDVGFCDDDGYYTIVDRAKDMIISGGFNVYSTEVEAAILAHEAVQECAVIGVPDEKWGEAIKAIVELKPGRETTADDIIALCKQKIGSVKAPKTVDFTDAIPRSAVGKVLKRELRAPYWEGRERLVG